MSIVARRQSHDPLKNSSKGSWILITNHPGNLVDRQLRIFERLARFADTQVLKISRRSHASGLVKSPKKRSLLEIRLRRHRGNRRTLCNALLQPVRNFQYRYVPVSQLWCEARVVTLLATRGVDQEKSRRREHDGRR